MPVQGLSTQFFNDIQLDDAGAPGKITAAMQQAVRETKTWVVRERIISQVINLLDGRPGIKLDKVDRDLRARLAPLSLEQLSDGAQVVTSLSRPWRYAERVLHAVKNKVSAGCGRRFAAGGS